MSIQSREKGENPPIPRCCAPRSQSHDAEPSAPSRRRLDDGTPFYGSLGVLARDEDEDLVQCHLCGRWLRAIGSSHLRRAHGWTLDEYRDAFKLPRGIPTWAHSPSRGQSIQAFSK